MTPIYFASESDARDAARRATRDSPGEWRALIVDADRYAVLPASQLPQAMATGWRLLELAAPGGTV